MRKCWEGGKKKRDKKQQNDGDDASLRVVGLYSFLVKSIFRLKKCPVGSKIKVSEKRVVVYFKDWKAADTWCRYQSIKMT